MDKLRVWRGGSTGAWFVVQATTTPRQRVARWRIVSDPYRTETYAVNAMRRLQRKGE